MSKHRLNYFLGIMLAIMTVLVLFASLGKRKYTAVSFLGKSEQEVHKWVQEQQIPAEDVIISYTFSDLPEGTVIYQNIKENDTFSADRALVLTVSKGEDPNQKIELIDFTGMNQESIERWLKNNGFTVYSFISEINEDKEEGEFLYSDPVSGKRLTKETEILIVMCEHDHSTTTILPDFTGKTVDDINTWAEENEIVPSYYYYIDESTPGTFLFCDLEAGTAIEKGSHLDFAISSGNGY